MPVPVLNKTYRCTHTYSHPNLGRMITKGRKYKCISLEPERDIVMMEGLCCCRAFFDSHFEEINETGRN